MAARTLSQRKPKDYRPARITLAQYYAKEEAKRRIRAQGQKLSHYFPKDITRMSMAILEAEPERYVTRSRETIARWIAADRNSRLAATSFAHNSCTQSTGCQRLGSGCPRKRDR
jgi:hypothetical protein